MLFAVLWVLPVGFVQAEDDTSEKILFGMSTALTGPAALLGQNMRQGILVGINRINRAGGIQNRPIELITLDDGYEPRRTSPNMRKLILDHDVLAVIGNVGTPTAVAALPIINREKVLFFAPYTGAGILRKQPPDHYVINLRASYVEETASMVDALISQGGVKPEEIAFFTQRDSFGDAGYLGGAQALLNHGLARESEILHTRYERNTLAVENALADILLHMPIIKAVIMVGAYAPNAKFIRLARKHGLDALFLNVSFVGSVPLAKALKGVDARVVVTQVVPHFNSDLPLVKEYRADLNYASTRNVASFGSLEGYLAMRVIEKATAKAEQPLTRETLVELIEGLGAFDIGLGVPMSLSADQHQASHTVWPTILHDNVFIPWQWSEMSTLPNMNTLGR
ncbi:MAG: ABC transporter substrate-binding protein [Magnetococcales bacterium]|nr:ABC transporter substrate-binding protein [Magnetococcales bacterium]